MENDELKTQKLNVPEPPSGIGSGFLMDFWSSKEPLPTISGIEVWWYYFQRGMQTVFALPTNSIICILTIAVSLFLLSGFLLILQNTGSLLNEAGSTMYLTAYFRSEAEEKDISVFMRELEKSAQVRSANFTSKEQALKNFRQDLGAHGSFLDGLEQNNPLPASVDIVLRPDAARNGSVEEVVKHLRQMPVIDEVVYGSQWVDKMQGVLKVFRFFGVVSFLTALAVIIFLISNTIKLVIYSRRDELNIMKLVGASDGFVKIPFMIGGLIQGVIGAIVGLLLLHGGYSLLNWELGNSQLFGISLPELSFLDLRAACAVVLIGLAVGAVGSFTAIGKFIQV